MTPEFTRIMIWQLLGLIAVTVIILFLGGCSHPHRFDPRSLEQQRAAQKACLDQGRPPPECRP